MRRFELRDGKSSKFWEIAVEGASHTVRFGAVGATGQLKTKAFASHAAAQGDADKLVKEKLKKGYVAVAEGAAAAKQKGGSVTGASEWIARLDAIEDLATREDLDAFRRLLEELEPVPKKESSLLAAILRVLERAQGQDDFGLFATAECLIDAFPKEVRAEGLRASIQRCVTWKALELLGDAREDRAALKHALEHQELGGLEQEVRSKLGRDDDAKEAAATPTRPARPADNPLFAVEDDGQALVLKEVTESAMRAARAAAPEALIVRLSGTPLDGAAAKRMLAIFPPLKLPSSHPWHDFASGPDFDVGNEPSKEVEKVLGLRIDRGVGVRHSKRAVRLAYGPLTSERIAIAKDKMPDAALVEISAEGLEAAIAKKLLATFPRASFAVSGALSPALVVVFAARLEAFECDAESVGALPPLPKLRRLKIEATYDEGIAAKAIAKFAKLASSCPVLEEIELSTELAPGIPALAKLPLKCVQISGSSPPVGKAVLEALAGHAHLRELSVWAPFDERAGALIGTLSQSLEGLTTSEGGDEVLAAAGKLRGLKRLQVSSAVTDAGLEAISRLTLSDLTLEGKKITDGGAAIIGSFRGLKALRITGASFSDAAVAKALASLTTLENADFEQCKSLGDAAFAAAVRCPEMRDVRWNGGATLGKKAMQALFDAGPRLERALVLTKLDDAAVAEAARYRKGAGRVDLDLRGLSKKQAAALGQH